MLRTVCVYDAIVCGKVRRRTLNAMTSQAAKHAVVICNQFKYQGTTVTRLKHSCQMMESFFLLFFVCKMLNNLYHQNQCIILNLLNLTNYFSL